MCPAADRGTKGPENRPADRELRSGSVWEEIPNSTEQGAA